MLLGFSDLHCNQAMTELITRLAQATRPRWCSARATTPSTARRWRSVASAARPDRGGAQVPLVVASGNHDSDVTETQQRAEGMVVLDGSTVDAAGLRVLGDDDPEHNVPFSQDRTLDRPETEDAAGAPDAAARPRPAPSTSSWSTSRRRRWCLMSATDPGARLYLGALPRRVRPHVVTHGDGSWTVGMQQGTAGGVRQPTITSFSTPFSPPLKSADVYFYFRDDATGLITGVQAVHFTPEATSSSTRARRRGTSTRLPEETRAPARRGQPPRPRRRRPAERGVGVRRPVRVLGPALGSRARAPVAQRQRQAA